MTDLDTWWAGGTHVTVHVGNTHHDIFVRDGGEGPALLLLHGFPASSFEWAALWPMLTAHHRVIAPDFLGYGASNKPRGHRYRFTEQADLIEALLAQLGVSAPDVLSYDYGAIVTQELLARRFPLGRVIFSNAGVIPRLYRPRLIQKLAIAPVLGPLLAVAANNTRTFTRTWGEVYSTEHPLDPQLAAQHFRAARSGDAPATLQSRLLAYIPERAAAAQRLEEALNANITRASFLWGMQDPVSGGTIADELRRRYPQADIVSYSDAGHCPHIEIPQRVAADVLARTSRNERP